jgi:hypothetical protein
MFKTFEILNFGHRDLFGIWDLRFGICASIFLKERYYQIKPSFGNLIWSTTQI